jgi:alkylmercury lyase
MNTPKLIPLIEHLKATRGKNWHHHRFFLRQLLRLVAQESPVAPNTIATALGLEIEIVQAQLEALQVYGCEFNARGELVGAILTQTATPHRVRVAERDLYAWCALDTLFLPALLQQVLEIRSVCPVTHEELTLVVTPEAVEVCHPPEAVISIVTAECRVPGPQGDFCGRIFFFASRAVATRWSRHQNGIEILPVPEAFELAHAVYIADES